MGQVKPNLFIVGAPKSGTSAMDQYLKAHPQIFMSQVKELHHFGSDLEFRTPLIERRQDRDVYLSYFAGWNGEPVVGEASVFYLSSREAAQEIYEFNPQARIIIMLRNPVDMMYSMYYQMRFTGEENLPSFEEALEAEERRKLGEDIPSTAGWAGGLHYRELARYTSQVKRYFDVFGHSQVHVIIFDDLKTDVKQAYRKTLEFLEVDNSFQPEFAVVNSSKAVRIPILRNFLMYPPRWYQTLLILGKKTVPARWRERVNKLLKSYNAIPYKRPPMISHTRRQLIREFRDEIDSLGNLLDRDLSPWITGTNR
jgi:hypothetical protein